MDPIPLPQLRRRRRWGQRLFLVAIAVVAVFTMAAGIGLAIVVRDIDGVQRFDLAGKLTKAGEAPVSADRIEVVEGDDDAPVTEAPPPPGPAENFLLVGSDNAANVDPDSPILIDREENEGVHLADTIMILRVRPQEQTAYLLSIPRDLDVDIPGLGNRRINSAYNLPDREDGAARLIDTIEQNFDIGIQHYVEVDLAAFTGLVDAIGGVDMCFEYPTRNPRTGLEIPTAGVTHLDGVSALQFVRSRSGYEELIDDQWVDGTGSDLERIERQQEFLSATIDEALDGGILTNPAQTNRIIGVIADIVTISNTLDVFGDGLDLARWFSDFGSERLTTEQLAVEQIPGSFQLRMTPDAEVQLDRLRGIEPDDVVAKRVRVTVLGDDPETRQATADNLAELGFAAETGTDPVSAGSTAAIRYGPEGGDAAVLTAAHLDGDVDWIGDPSLEPDEVVVELPAAPPDVLTVPRVVPGRPGPVVTTTPGAQDDPDDPAAGTGATTVTTGEATTTTEAPPVCG